MVIDKGVENIEQEIEKLTFGFPQILCHEKLSKEAADKKDQGSRYYYNKCWGNF